MAILWHFITGRGGGQCRQLSTQLILRNFNGNLAPGGGGGGGGGAKIVQLWLPCYPWWTYEFSKVQGFFGGFGFPWGSWRNLVGLSSWQHWAKICICKLVTPLSEICIYIKLNIRLEFYKYVYCDPGPWKYGYKHNYYDITTHTRKDIPKNRIFGNVRPNLHIWKLNIQLRTL